MAQEPELAYGFAPGRSPLDRLDGVDFDAAEVDAWEAGVEADRDLRSSGATGRRRRRRGTVLQPPVFDVLGGKR